MCYCPNHPDTRADECPELNCDCIFPAIQKQSVTKKSSSAQQQEPPTSEEIDAMCEVPG